MFATEAELVAAFCACIDPAKWSHNPSYAPKWVQYHETAGWDLLLVHPTGVQIGIEAKLTLNAKVLEQALPGRWADPAGPDFRAVLVPSDGLQNHLRTIAHHLGIVAITVRRVGSDPSWSGHHQISPTLPDPETDYVHSLKDWPNWCPITRCAVPDYVPDVTGGHSSPVTLSPWKIKAIKLLILLERNGAVTRRDMNALGLSPSRWTDRFHGFLTPGAEGGYVRNSRTPDLKAQHPTNWAQIEADYDTWSKGVATAGRLLGAAA
jgi:hypothetical protein